MTDEDDHVINQEDGGDTTIEDIALSSVSDAIEAVENVDEPVKSEENESPLAQPHDQVPELDDVENPEEMVGVLLTVGEERSRRNDVKGALAAFNKAIALDPSCDMAWFNRGVLLEAQQDARGRDNRSKSVSILTINMPQQRRIWPFFWNELATLKAHTLRQKKRSDSFRSPRPRAVEGAM